MSLVELLKQNKCPCKKKNKDIDIKDCDGPSCSQHKSCMKKTNTMFEKEIKR